MCNCVCGWPVFTKYAKTYICPKCGGSIECDGITLPQSLAPAEEVKSSTWVRLVKLLRKPEDQGVGDTVQRIAAKFGGERFKAFSKRIGIPCGCTDRQAAWNQQWPY